MNQDERQAVDEYMSKGFRKSQILCETQHNMGILRRARNAMNDLLSSKIMSKNDTADCSDFIDVIDRHLSLEMEEYEAARKM